MAQRLRPVRTDRPFSGRCCFYLIAAIAIRGTMPGLERRRAAPAEPERDARDRPRRRSWRKLVGSRQVWMLCWQYFRSATDGISTSPGCPPICAKRAMCRWAANRVARHSCRCSSAELGNPACCGGAGLACAGRNVSVTHARRIMTTLGFARPDLVPGLPRHPDVRAAGHVCYCGMASFCNDLARWPCAWWRGDDVARQVRPKRGPGALEHWGLLRPAACARPDRQIRPPEYWSSDAQSATESDVPMFRRRVPDRASSSGCCSIR